MEQAFSPPICAVLRLVCMGNDVIYIITASLYNNITLWTNSLRWRHLRTKFVFVRWYIYCRYCVLCFVLLSENPSRLLNDLFYMTVHVWHLVAYVGSLVLVASAWLIFSKQTRAVTVRCCCRCGASVQTRICCCLWKQQTSRRLAWITTTTTTKELVTSKSHDAAQQHFNTTTAHDFV